MYKILVTGGYGLVGSEFIGSEYKKIGSKYCDLRDSHNTNNLFSIDHDKLYTYRPNLGFLPSNHKLFRPRQYNFDFYTNPNIRPIWTLKGLLISAQTGY